MNCIKISNKLFYAFCILMYFNKCINYNVLKEKLFNKVYPLFKWNFRTLFLSSIFFWIKYNLCSYKSNFNDNLKAHANKKWHNLWNFQGILTSQLGMSTSLHVSFQSVRVIAHRTRVRFDFVMIAANVLLETRNPFECLRAKRTAEFAFGIVLEFMLLQLNKWWKWLTARITCKFSIERSI